jgi:hypothetical protein
MRSASTPEDRPPHLRHRLRHRRRRRAAFTTIGSTGPTSGSLYIVDAFLVVTFGGAAACSARWPRPSALRRAVHRGVLHEWIDGEGVTLAADRDPDAPAARACSPQSPPLNRAEGPKTWNASNPRSSTQGRLMGKRPDTGGADPARRVPAHAGSCSGSTWSASI